MDVIVYPSSVEGTVKAPPSKSYTHRALFAALLAEGYSRVVNPLISGDTRFTLKSVEKFGARVSLGAGSVVVRGSGEVESAPWIYCGGSGTTLRLSAGVASLSPGPTLLYGNRSLNRRPMGPLISALESLGAPVISRQGMPPLSIGGIKGRPGMDSVVVDASVSSQFVSALLFIAPVLGVRVETRGPVRSRPYIDLTIAVLERFGVRVERDGYRVYEVKGRGYKPAVFRVPGDYSSASFLLAAGAIAGRVRVTGLDPLDPQPDRVLASLLKVMGARVVEGDGWLEVESGGALEGLEADLNDSPDLAPIMSVLGAYARGVTVLRGVGHIAFKETDRLEAIRRTLGRLGASVRVTREEIRIRGGEVRGGVSVPSFGDHRIAMALFVAGLGSKGPVRVRGFGRYRDSYPGFLEDFTALGARYEVV